MPLSKRAQKRETISNNSLVGVFAIKGSGAVEQIMKSFDELRPTIGGAHLGNSFADHLQSVMMVVFIRSTRNCQAIVFVLDVTPEQVVQWPQRINFQVCQWIVVQWSTSVLEAHADSIHGLHQHSLFMPVRPDQFEHAWTSESMRKRSLAEWRYVLVES